MSRQQPGQQPHSRLLRDLQLPDQELALLASHGLATARDVLLLSAFDLVERLGVPLSQAQRLLQHIAMQTAPPFVTALQLHEDSVNHSVHVLTGLPALDEALRIGLPPGAITELVGPAGVGKSQFCYTLALQVALPRSLGGLDACAMYLDTERKFSVERLLQMTQARLAAAPAAALAAAVPGAGSGTPAAQAGPASQQDIIERVLNRVLVVTADSPEALQAHLAGLSTLVAQRDIKLVLLDSAAALLRIADFAGAAGTGDGSALAARGQLLGQQAITLKALAEAHRIPVVVTNQVTGRVTGPATHSFQQQPQQPGGGGEGQTAALGTKWAHAVNVRLLLDRQGTRRVISIGKSPLSANVAVAYVIDAAGVAQAADGGGGAQGGGAAVLLPPRSALDMRLDNLPG